jgi:hypothetical protein
MRDNEQTIYDQIERDLLELPAANSAVEAAAMAVRLHYRIIRFRGKVMLKVPKPYPHFMTMDKEMFEWAAQPLLGHMPRRYVNNVYDYLCHTAANLTANDHYILFGAGTNRQTVWDMKWLEARTDVMADDCVWRSPYAPIATDHPIKFIMDLAGGDMGRYSDIMQSLAPLVMSQKPVGVIWWVGNNVDGKTALIGALHRIFSDQLTSLTVGQLNGGRSNTPLLNSVLGNVAVDSGSQITNTETYKSIGTHEDFFTHRWHSQNGMTIRGNVHHIFASSHAPTFYTRDLSIDQRTHTVPFSQAGKAHAMQPNSFYGQLLAEMCRYADIIKQQRYSYDWSTAGIESEKPEPALSRPGPPIPEFRW